MQRVLIALGISGVALALGQPVSKLPREGNSPVLINHLSSAVLEVVFVVPLISHSAVEAIDSVAFLLACDELALKAPQFVFEFACVD